MIKWKRIEAGEYESEDGRFKIDAVYDRVYGNHWCLTDRNETDRYKGQYHQKSLLDCKMTAERIK